MHVDAAVHVWSADPDRYPWSPGAAPYTPSSPATAEQLLMTQGEVDFAGAVCVQPIVYGTDHRYLASVLTADPGRFAGVCRIDRHDPATPQRLRELIVGDGFGGVRVLCYRDEDAWIAGPDADAIWELAAEFGIVVYVMARPDQLAAAADRAREFPGVTVALDHLGLVRGDASADELAALLAASEPSNVVVKASAFGYLAALPWPYPDVGRVLRETYAAFGAERVLYGSDWPVSLEHCPYARSLEAFDIALGLAGTERDLVLGGNVRRLFPRLAASPA